MEGIGDRGKQRETLLTYLEKMTDRTPVEQFLLTRESEKSGQPCVNSSSKRLKRIRHPMMMMMMMVSLDDKWITSTMYRK